MLLNELTGIKSFKDKPGKEILDYLKSTYGIQQSAGTFGVVLSHPSWKHVLKLFAKDDCYLHFVDYVLKHPNPHFPKVEKKPVQLTTFFKKSATTPDKFYVVKMEKLEKLGKAELNLFDSMDSKIFVETYKEAVKHDDVKGWVTHITKELKIDPFLLKKNLGFIKAYLEIEDMELPASCKTDLHSENVMKRKDGTMVIIDPYKDAHMNDSEYKVSEFIDSIINPTARNIPTNSAELPKEVGDEIANAIK